MGLPIIPEDIRSKIAQLDQLAGELYDYFHDEYMENTEESDYMGEDKEKYEFRQEFKNSIETLQGEITEIQESEGWI